MPAHPACRAGDRPHGTGSEGRRIPHAKLGIVRTAPDQKFAASRAASRAAARRRLAREYERHPAASEAMIRWTAISGVVRRLSRGQS